MNITLKDLLDAGVHMGHQTRRYNPKSKKYVYDHRHGISIIDLEKTYAKLEEACNYVEELVASGKDLLFVGTKKQARDIVREAALGCNMPHATSRWLGGALTNYETVQRSIAKYKKYLQWESDGTMDKMHNKEVAAIRREMNRMKRNFEGILDMGARPGALFVVDTKTEYIAVAEANRLGVPIVALVDTNSDPSLVNYPIPGNDDAIKAIRIMVEAVMDAVQAGLARRETKEAIQPRTVTPVVADNTNDEQVRTPEAPASAAGKEGEEVPTSFSSED